MSHGKQFTLFSHKIAVNGWKVAVVLEELGLTYESVFLDFQKGEQKSPEFTQYNPNARIPALIDHCNNNFVLWESTAIFIYLAVKYDPEHKISASTESDKLLQLQYLSFQSSEQFSYFSGFYWFTVYHPEKVPSAIERYKKETLRILGVLDGILEKQEWLVSGKPTIADLCFVVVTRRIFDHFTTDQDPVNVTKEFPAVVAWQEKLEARAAVRRVIGMQAAAKARIVDDQS